MDVFAAQLPWYISGPALGLLVIAGYWAANQALGGIGSFAAFQRFLARPGEGPGWRVFFLGGLVAGGVLSAVLAGDLRPTFAYGSLDQTFVGATPLLKGGVRAAGGLLMGLGAKVGGGCTLGHGMCGSATLSPASLVSTMIFMGTAIALSHLWLWAGVLG